MLRWQGEQRAWQRPASAWSARGALPLSHAACPRGSWRGCAGHAVAGRTPSGGVYVVMRRQCGGRQRRALQGLVGERRAPASRWQAAQQWSLVRGAARKAGGSGHASKGSPGQWVGRPVRRSLARRGAGIGASGR
jgi:hypothetical protein